MKNVRTPQGGFFLTHTVYVYFVFFFVFWGLFSFVASPSVLWCCWLGLLTCKNRRPCNLYCVGADVKPRSINQSIWGQHELIQGSFYWGHAENLHVIFQVILNWTETTAQQTLMTASVMKSLTCCTSIWWAVSVFVNVWWTAAFTSSCSCICMYTEHVRSSCMYEN